MMSRGISGLQVKHMKTYEKMHAACRFDTSSKSSKQKRMPRNWRWTPLISVMASMEVPRLREVIIDPSIHPPILPQHVTVFNPFHLKRLIIIPLQQNQTFKIYIVSFISHKQKIPSSKKTHSSQIHLSSKHIRNYIDQIRLTLHLISNWK